MPELDLASLPSAAMIGECIMPRLNVEAFENNEAYRATITALLSEHKAGGFCVFGGSPEVVANTTSSLQEVARTSHGTPLIFSADCEFGLPMRFTGGTEFPDAMAIARTGVPELARAAGQAIAQEMRTLGLTWNFAPVADVNSNPKNPIINTRSFGGDPETVIRFAVPFMEGLQSEGVAASAKHFPGHGDTSQDSHKELPFLNAPYERFEIIELPPFEALINVGVSSVMTGHLAAPQLAQHLAAKGDEAKLPATLSKAMTTRLLRGQLGFDGVIVTDALEMHAITDLFGEEEAVVRSFEAGTDVLLLPPNPNGAFEALTKALNNGRISVADLRERMHRIQKLKQFAKPSGINLERLSQLVAEHQQLATTIAERAIEVSGSLDITDSDLLVLTDDRVESEKKAELFANNLKSAFRSTKVINIRDWAQQAVTDTTITATFHRARGYLGGQAESVTMPQVIREIAGESSPRGLILIGSPYLDQEFSTPPSFVLKTFSESTASIKAAINLILRSGK
jgi:beta-N-acetylhexosaminidase